MPLDVHLDRQSNPLEQLPWFLEAGADIGHRARRGRRGAIELERAVEMIHAAGAKAAVIRQAPYPRRACSPRCMAQLDMVLIMSVEPGFSGQSYIEGSER